MAEVELNPYQKQAFSPCPSEHVLQAADRKTNQGKKCVAVMSNFSGLSFLPITYEENCFAYSQIS